MSTSALQPKSSTRSFSKLQDQRYKIPISSRRKDSAAERMDILKEIEELFLSTRRKDSDEDKNDTDEDIEQILMLPQSINPLKESQSKDRPEDVDTVGVLNIMKSLQDEIQVS